MASPATPSTKKTIVLGTAGQGPTNVAYPVTDPTQAAADYGLAGDLIQSMEEVRTFCDNITLYRLGTKPGTLSGVGLDTTPGANGIHGHRPALQKVHFCGVTPGFSLSMRRLRHPVNRHSVWPADTQAVVTDAFSRGLGVVP